VAACCACCTRVHSQHTLDGLDGLVSLELQPFELSGPPPTPLAACCRWTSLSGCKSSQKRSDCWEHSRCAAAVIWWLPAPADVGSFMCCRFATIMHGFRFAIDHSLLKFVQDAKNVYLVTEMCEGGTLEQCMKVGHDVHDLQRMQPPLQSDVRC
jgi:hypothetical protein